MKDDADKIMLEPDDAREAEPAGTKKTIRVLVFSLGDELYCVDVRDAKEVSRVGSVTRVPAAPDFIAGITNVRGEVIPVIDIRYLLGLPLNPLTENARIILTDIRHGILGILADGIRETREIEEASIQPPLATIRRTPAAFTRGEIKLSDGIMAVLDLAKILETEEIERLRKGGQKG